MQVIDNALSKASFILLSEDVFIRQYQSNHGAGDATYTFKFSSSINLEEGNIYSSAFKEIEHLFDGYEVYRAYINAMKFGEEDSIHEDDCEVDGGLTAIIYLNDTWYPEWFGQTVLFNGTNKDRDNNYLDNDIIMSVLPKPNRLVMFDKEIPHCVSPMSKRFAGMRYTLMYKLRKI